MYNTQPVNISRAFTIARAYMRTGLIPLFIGSPGCGKTTLAAMLAKDFDADLYSLRLNNSPPEDATGLQFIDQENKRTVRYAPSWVPAADGSDGNRVIFVDELLQATDESRKGIMSAFLERYLGEHKLPDNLWFIAAGNSSADGSAVYELDSATAARFAIIRVASEFEQWSRDFAPNAKIALSIMGFLRMRPELFDGYDSEEKDQAEHEDEIIRASSRRWAEASMFLETATTDGLIDDDMIVGLSGILGSRIAKAFWAVHGKIASLPTLDEIAKMSRSKQAKSTPECMDVLWAYGQAMIWGAKSTDKILSFMDIFDGWAPDSSIPFVETRAHILESMLDQARNRFDVDTREEPRIGERIKIWKSAAAAANDPDGATTPTETLQLAA